MDRLISEKQVLDTIADFIKNNYSVAKLILNINAIPSAEPKEGHWIDGGEYICFGGRQKAPCICSVCRKSALNEPWYYCPNCGAKMEVKQNGQTNK